MMKRLLLVGGGHAHALVLLGLIRQPIKNVEIIVISPVGLVPYSGMIPGWLAGQYKFEDTVIDFVALCNRAGARWVEAELTSLQPDCNIITLSTGEQFTYDWLSINIGSTLRPPELKTAAILAMRPLWTLQERYPQLLEVWSHEPSQSTLNVTAVGAGAAGVESLLCILHRLRQLRPDRVVNGYLTTRASGVLPGFNATAQRYALQSLHQAGVTIQAETAGLIDSKTVNDLIIWATGAQAHGWQLDPDRHGNLQVSKDGFIQIDEMLRSLSHSNVFAVGDCAQLPETLPKAGVFAVRMATTLEINLRHVLVALPLERFKVQRVALALLNTADGKAIATRSRWAFRGRWAWVWKDYIDRKFIHHFRSGNI